MTMSAKPRNQNKPHIRKCSQWNYTCKKETCSIIGLGSTPMRAFAEYERAMDKWNNRGSAAKHRQNTDPHQ